MLHTSFNVASSPGIHTAPSPPPPPPTFQYMCCSLPNSAQNKINFTDKIIMVKLPAMHWHLFMGENIHGHALTQKIHFSTLKILGYTVIIYDPGLPVFHVQS